MVIAVITLNWTGHSKAYFFQYASAIIREMMVANPGHRFIIFHDKNFDKDQFPGNYFSFILVNWPGRLLGLRYWCERRFPAYCKKLHVDAAIWLNGFCSLKSNIPQFVFYPGRETGRKNMYSGYRQKFAEEIVYTAKKIFVPTQRIKNELEASFSAAVQKTVISPPLNLLRSRAQDETEKNAVKQQVTGGKEFFVYEGNNDDNQLMVILKAFSLFKKRQQTNMQLVILLADPPGKKLIRGLASFKYKHDVVLIKVRGEDEKIKFFSAAYGALLFAENDETGIPALSLLSLNIPLVTTTLPSYKEILGEAALFTPPDDAQKIADAMMLLYKDESLRKRMIQNGAALTAHPGYDNTAGMIWETILQTIQ